jgi:trk system potassium uptake protein
MKINLQPVSNVLGILLLLLGALMLLCMLASWYYESGDGSALFQAGSVTMILGILSWLYKFKSSENYLSKREGYLIVAFGWIFMGLCSSLPYYFSGVTDTYTDAFFEAFSGLTTTGATILRDIENVPEGILLWRSITQWLGGMGIIVLTVALFPILGIAGIELFGAEAPGPTSEKLHPRIKGTALRLWLIYMGLTISAALVYYLGGMTGFDAINHSLTSISTGGFSTKNESIAYFQSSFLDYSIIFFMFCGGTNFLMLYYIYKLKFNRVWANNEFRVYFYYILIASLLVGIGILYSVDSNVEEAFRHALFAVVSMATTTGYGLGDYTSWSPLLSAFFFMLLFSGACAGSTSGGIKLIRHIVFVKNSILEFKRILHPRAVIRIKMNDEIVAPRILTHILVFLLVYLFIFFIGFIILYAAGMDMESAISGSATSIGNVGPALGSLGPTSTYADMPDIGKWTMPLLMVIGRLELFTVLVFFTPYFWQINK